MTRFLLFVASHDTAPDEDVPGLIVAGRQGAYPMLSRAQWRHEANLTVEHIAPNSNNRAGWPLNIYNDQRTIHRLGNLVLMPKAENNAIGNRPWNQKRILYRMFSARTARQAERAMQAARAFGFNVDKTAQEVAATSLQLPMCEAIAQYDEAWDEAFVGVRSQRLAELAWDRMWIWLAPPVAVVPARRRRG